MIELNRRIGVPGQIRSNVTQLSFSGTLAALAFVIACVWTPQSHAGDIWLWSWLGINDLQIVRGADGVACKEVNDASHATKPAAASTSQKSLINSDAKNKTPASAASKTTG